MNVPPDCAPTNEIEEWAELIDDQTTDRMLTLLTGLSVEARDIVTAHAIDGESFLVIGQRYGYSDEWARIRFNRAINAIKRKEREHYRLFKADGTFDRARMAQPNSGADARQLEADYSYYVRNGARASMIAATRRGQRHDKPSWPLRYGTPKNWAKVYTPEQIAAEVAKHGERWGVTPEEPCQLAIAA